MIYVFGDSHRARFIHYDNHNNEVSLIKPLGRSGLTAHGVGGKPEYIAEELSVVEPDDVVLFVLGEVDCRVHFYLHHRQDCIPIKKLISTTVKRYGKAILLFKEYQIAVLDVIPAVKQGNAYNVEFYGSREERSDIIVEFNRQLGKWCKENNIPFIATHHLLADSHGFLKVKYSVDDAHASEGTVELIDLNEYFPGAAWCE